MDDIQMGMLSLFAPSYYARIKESQRAAEKAEYERLKKNVAATDFDEKRTPFQKIMFLKSSSWKPVTLFDVQTIRHDTPEKKWRQMGQKCPGSDFLYVHILLQESHPLKVYQGFKRGLVYFDGPVTTPSLWHWPPGGNNTTWMGYTPMEAITQRSGVKAAKGRVVVGGLGLGWFLNAVCAKPAVSEVVLVERDVKLVEWLRPILEVKYPAIGKKCKQWVCSDIYDYMESDTQNHATTRYLLDIWDGYREYDRSFWKWHARLPEGALWGWGQFSGDS